MICAKRIPNSHISPIVKILVNLQGFIHYVYCKFHVKIIFEPYASRTHGRDEKCVQNVGWKTEKRDGLEELGVGVKINMGLTEIGRGLDSSSSE
jgi:hypothetical protein